MPKKPPDRSAANLAVMLRRWARRACSEGAQHPVLTLGLALLTLGLGSTDLVERLSQFNSVTSSTFFPYFHYVHNLAAMVILFYVAYRGLPGLAMAMAILFGLSHGYYLHLAYSEAGAEMFGTFLTTLLGMAAIGLIAALHGAQATLEDSEHKLRVSERRLEEAQSVAHIGSWERDLATGELLWSDETFRIFGLDIHNTMPSFEVFLNSIDPQDLSRVKESIADAINNKKPYNVDFGIVRPDGSRRVINAVADVIFDDTGKPSRMIGVVQDITERKQTEEASRASKELLDKTFAALDQTVFIVAPGTRTILNSNRAVEHIFGYRPAEVVGRNTEFLYMNQETYRDYGKALLPALDKEGIYNTEVPMRRKDGTSFPSEITSTQIVDDTGHRTAVISVVRDISERLRAANALKASEARLREAQSLAHIGSWEWDLVTDDLFWSDEIYRIWGWDPRNATGRPEPVWDAMEEPYRGQGKMALKNALKNGQPYEIDIIVVRPDGTKRTVNAQGRPIVDGTGKTVKVVGTLQDITERKHAEEERARLAEVLDATSDLVIVGTPDIGGAVYCNRAALEMAGLGPNEDLYERFLGDPRFQEIRAPLLEVALPAAERSGRWAGELSFKKKAGGLRHLSVVFMSHKPKDGKMYFSMVGRDITEQKEAEKQVRASLAEKEVLLKEVHHRVKNNLQVLSSLMNLKAQQVDGATSAVLHELQGRVLAMALIHERLYQSEQFAGIDFAAYLKELVADLAASCQACPGDVNIMVDAKDVSLPLDKAVPCALIVTELVSNSFKHAFPDGRSGHIWVDLRPEGDEFALLVRDDGVGLPPGRDLHSNLTLGLRLVDSLARQLGGALEVSSNGGATFKVRWPARYLSTANT